MTLFCPMLTKCFRSLNKAPNAVTLIPAQESTLANTRADGVGSGQLPPTIVGWALSAGSNHVLPAPTIPVHGEACCGNANYVRNPNTGDVKSEHARRNHNHVLTRSIAYCLCVPHKKHCVWHIARFCSWRESMCCMCLCALCLCTHVCLAERQLTIAAVSPRLPQRRKTIESGALARHASASRSALNLIFSVTLPR